MINQVLNRLKNWIWSRNLSTASLLERILFTGLRLFYVIVLDLSRGQITMRAMGLVYTSLMSLIPLLAFSFSLLKALDLHNVIQPMLTRFLRPLGPQSTQISNKLIGFVQQMNVGVLGVAGLALLVYMVTLLVQKLESDLNFIWNIKNPRNLRRRISDYISILLVGPVLVFGAATLTAAASSTSFGDTFLGVTPLGNLLFFLSKLVPYLLICGGFVLLYMFVPNTSVHFLPALKGGLLAGILWQSGSWLFAAFVAGSGRYNAIYSGFAIVVLLLIWLYLSWIILLVGGRVAFYLQHPESLSEKEISPRPGARLELELALMVVILVNRNFQSRDTPWTPDSLAHCLHIPMNLLEPVLETLIAQGLLVEGGAGEDYLIPAQDPATLRVPELMAAVTRGEYSLQPGRRHEPSFRIASGVLSRLETAAQEAVGQVTIKDLVNELGDDNKKVSLDSARATRSTY